MISILVRAVHQVGAAVFLGGILLGHAADTVHIYLEIACASGVILMITESIRHRQLLREVSGMTTLLKLVILGVAFSFEVPSMPLILFSFILASIFSHAPKIIRHRLLF